MKATALMYTLVLVAAAAAAPGPTPTQDDPIHTITTCGGYINSTSAAIEFQVGASIRADQKCVWTLNNPRFTTRFILTNSGLSDERDGIYLTNFFLLEPSLQQKMTTVGQNYSMTAGVILITLEVGHAPTMGFRLEMFSHPLLNNTMELTGYHNLNMNSGTFSYPIGGGQYQNSENVFFLVNPYEPLQRTLTFTRMDTEYSSICQFDKVTIYNWFDHRYTQVAQVCGTTLPPAITLQSGICLITFVTDASVISSGFDFEWV